MMFTRIKKKSMINSCLTVGTNQKNNNEKIAFMMIYGDFISVRPLSIDTDVLKGYSTFFLEIGSFYNSPRIKQLSFTVFESIQLIF